MGKKLFHTKFVTSDYYRFPPFPYKAKGWELTLRPIPSEIPWQTREMYVDSRGRTRISEGKEIVISADSAVIAQRVLNLLHGSKLLLDGSGFFGVDDTDILIVERRRNPELKAEEHRALQNGLFSTAGLPQVCMIATKAYSRRKYQYAISKLRLSYEIASWHYVDTDPNYSPTLPKSAFSETHVKYAYSIVLAYAVIEELGLELRASNKNPSQINGQWNPTAKQDLEKRLRKAGIDLSEHFVWLRRGPNTKLDQERPTKSVSKASWARYWVRDTMVEVVDAIAHLSWLRSRVSAHRMRPELVRVLSPYDVTNAQHLARRLLLEALGYWRYLG